MGGIGLAIWIAVIVFGVVSSIRKGARRPVPVANPQPAAPAMPYAPNAPVLASAPSSAGPVVVAVPAPPAPPRPAQRAASQAASPLHPAPFSTPAGRAVPGFGNVSALRAAVVASTVLGEPRALREYRGPGL